MADKVQTGSVEIPLSKSIKIDGTEVKALVMREPTVGDQLTAIKQGKNDSAESEISLFANLCEVTPSDIKQLSLRDYGKVQKVFKGFTD